jgi:hypothetical protein
LSARLAAALAAAALAGCGGVREKAPVRYVPVSFADLPAWQDADPRPAFEAFRRSCTAVGAVDAMQARWRPGG